jgi:alcohol dehydrogenase (cytochrome c)
MISPASRTGACLISGLLALLSIVVVLPRTAGAQNQPDASRLEHTDREPQNWLTYYGNYAGWSYSPLDQITRQNVKKLVPVWSFAAGVSNPGLRQGLEAAPLVVNGVLYLVGMQNNVYALDAATGRIRWTYTYKWPQEGVPPGPRGARGLAFGDARIYMGTQDNHLVALDAESGREVWNVEVQDASKCNCGMTSAPLFIGGKIIAGSAGGDLGYMRGYVIAFDAESGKLIWHFEVIPAPGEPGSETWMGDQNAWKVGGGAPWFTGTYDPQLHLTFWGTGNAYPDYDGETRPGDNLYTNSLLALDVNTGKLKWYFQETPHDVYDYDSASEAIILNLTVSGQNRNVLLHPGKNGFVYVYDRGTGRFLYSFPYGRPTWNKGIGRDGKPIDPVDPKKLKEFLLCPATQHGARGISHSAYSPHTGWWYTTDFEYCSYIKGPGVPNQGVINPAVPPNISAFDPATGAKQWQFNTKYFNVSSLLATAGDLVFAGDLEGNAFALDARTGQKLWSFNTGGRIVSPPIAFSLNGRQYVTISTGGGSSTEAIVPRLWPEAAGHTPQPTSALFVFALPQDNP